MRPIKFRGRDLDSGEYVFGFYTTGSDNKSFIIVTSTQGQYLREVKPDSVAQLVGYDANGKEVYEGDTVLRYDSEEEFIEAPENGVLREVVLYTQVNPDLEAYYCLVEEIHQCNTTSVSTAPLRKSTATLTRGSATRTAKNFYR